MAYRAQLSVKYYDYDLSTGEVKVSVYEPVDWSGGDLGIHGSDFNNLPVTWSGNSFSASHPEDTGAWTFSGNVDETGQVLLSITAEGQYLKTWYEEGFNCEATESKNWTVKAINVPRDPVGYIGSFPDKVHFRYHREDVSNVTMTYTRSKICRYRGQKKKEESAELIKLTWFLTDITFSVEPLPW
jgi:hypothetical protein